MQERRSRLAWQPLVGLAALLYGGAACAAPRTDIPQRPATPSAVYEAADSIFVADGDRSKRVDRLFARWDSDGSPGAAVSVVRDGEIVHARGYGAANLEYDVPITPATPFHVASVSKHFTAFAIALLAEEGMLSFDDDVRDHLPYVPDFGETITLRHLVHHTSGLRDQWELLATAGWRLDDVITTDQILDLVRHQEALNFRPGSEYLYSNTGYTLLAEVVGSVTGMTLAEFAEERIFAPLGMTRTHFHDDHQRIVPGRAYSYAPAEGHGYRHAPLNYATVGATSLFTTVEDLARWEANFLAPEVGSPSTILEMEERGVLITGDTIAYARALMIGDHRGSRTVGHGGADAGYRSHFLRFPEEGLAVIVLANLSSFDAASVARRVADVYLDHRPSPPLRLPEIVAGGASAVEVDPAELLHLEGLYAEAHRNQTRRFEVVDGQLVLRTGSEPRLRPLGDGRFMAETPSRPLLYTFEIGPDGGVRSVREEAEGQRPVVYRPVRRRDAEVLRELEGVYRSRELGTEYTISVGPDGLSAHHRRHGRIGLLPTLDDRALGDRWWLRDLRFTRDARGEIDGFLLTGSRVRNLRFERVGDAGRSRISRAPRRTR